MFLAFHQRRNNVFFLSSQVKLALNHLKIRKAKSSFISHKYFCTNFYELNFSDTAKQNGPTSYVTTSNGNATHMTTSNWANQEATKSLKNTLGIGAGEMLNQQQRPLAANTQASQHQQISAMSYAAQAGKQIAKAPVEMPGNSYGNLDVQFGSFDSSLNFDDAGKVAGQKM